MPTFAPNSNPSAYPTTAPSGFPSVVPSNAPTRVPSGDVDELFDVEIDMECSVSGLSEADKSWLSGSTQEAVPLLEEVLARNYIDTANGVAHDTFKLAISTMNLDLLTLLIGAEIQCEDSVGELIIARSQTSGSETSFAFGVQSDLRDLFNTSALTFAVVSVEQSDEIANSINDEQETADDDDVTATHLTAMLIMAAVSVMCSMVAVAACACACYQRKVKQQQEEANMMATQLQMPQPQKESAAGGEEDVEKDLEKSTTEIVLEAEMGVMFAQASTAL